MAAKKKKATKKALKIKEVTPDGLDGLWDEDTEIAWKKLTPKQQKFLQEWLTNGNNGTKAYQVVYNDLANDNVSSSSANQLLRNINIGVFLDKMCDSNKSDLVLAKTKLRAAMDAYKPVYGKDSQGQPEKIEDIPDHKTIIDATNSLMKLNGEYIEKGESNVQINKTLTINHNVMGDLNNYLVKAGHKPVVSQTKTVKEEDTAFETFGEDDMEVIE